MRGRVRPFLCGWAAYALLYFAFCFHPGVVSSDDFGYLRSILGTYAAHRPYVYEWLEPYCAVFSSACALLYALTGNFPWSAWGFQAACALAGYPLLFRLLAARLRPGHAASLALAVLTSPLYLVKAGDFHAAACTLDLFLLALLLAEARRWGGFLAVAFLAFANRQNHVCLLLLPLWAAVQGLQRAQPVTAVIPAGIVAWAVAAAALVFSMNKTYAAAHAAFRHESLPALATHAAVALAAGITMSLGWLAAASALTGRAAAWRRQPRGWIAPAVLAAGLLCLIPFWGPNLLLTDIPFFGLADWPRINRVLPWLLLAALFAVDYRLFRPSPYLLLLAGYIGLASLRGVWWDYYFCEIALLALLLALDQAPAPALPRLSIIALALTMLMNAGYAYMLKIQSDKQRLAVTAMERLERAHKVSLDAMTGATFGYLGWKLFDHYIAHEGLEFDELHGFLGYVRRDRVEIETELPWRRSFKADLPPGADSLAGGICRIGYATVRYRIVDRHGPQSELPILGRAMRLDSTGFRSPRFPLDAGEWDAFINGVQKDVVKGVATP